MRRMWVAAGDSEGSVFNSVADVSAFRLSNQCQTALQGIYLADRPPLWSSLRPHPVTSLREIWYLLSCLRMQQQKTGHVKKN